jgi:hypothetical protein
MSHVEIARYFFATYARKLAIIPHLKFLRKAVRLRAQTEIR